MNEPVVRVCESSGYRQNVVVDVRSKSQGTVLGQIKWFSGWRQYCFFPSTDTVFNLVCLADIMDRIYYLKGVKQNEQSKLEHSSSGSG